MENLTEEQLKILARVYDYLTGSTADAIGRRDRLADELMDEFSDIMYYTKRYINDIARLDCEQEIAHRNADQVRNIFVTRWPEGAPK
jgi:hypothetical protein